jgi:hypothetical protein
MAQIHTIHPQENTMVIGSYDDSRLSQGITNHPVGRCRKQEAMADKGDANVGFSRITENLAKRDASGCFEDGHPFDRRRIAHRFAKPKS